jgi:hypothetical protein
MAPSNRPSNRPSRPDRILQSRSRPRRCTLKLEELEDRLLLSAASQYGQLPLAFEPNVGQVSGPIDFLTHGNGYSLYLNHGQAELVLQSAIASTATGGSILQAATAETLGISFVGTNPVPAGSGVNRLPGITNYFIGNDPSKWHTNIPTYSQVAYQDIYAGINELVYGNQGQLEYDLVVNPGASPGVIRFAVAGTMSTTIDSQGNLVLHTPGGDVVERAPIVYQQMGNVRRSVAGRFVLENQQQVGFAVGAYDASQPLVIDPVLSYSTYLGLYGGFAGGAAANDIAVDSSGEAYVVGEAVSSLFPTANAVHVFVPGADAYVAKLNAAGTGLIYATFLGSSAIANSVAVDAAGDAYVTGWTSATNFPTVNPAQPGSKGGGDEAFVAELNAAGSTLIYSTYLGGSAVDRGQGIAVDGAGDAFVTGKTSSSDFPTVNAVQPANRSTQDNAFVTKFSAGGSISYSTYLGGSGSDSGNGIGVDAAGNAIITGVVTSTDFPTVNAIQTHLTLGSAGFVTKLNPAGSFLYSTYLGPATGGAAVAVDAAGNAYVTGIALNGFPTTFAFQPISGLGGGVFVSKINASGTALAYSTYTGNSDAQPFAIAVDVEGDAYVTGNAGGGSAFPTANALQPVNKLANAFVAELNPLGNGFVYSTYLGGTSYVDEAGRGIAVDTAGNTYVAGTTGASDFPTVMPIQSSYAGGGGLAYTGFVAKIANHTWQGQDISAGVAGETSLLWQTSNGNGTVWTLNSSLAPSPGPIYGPIAGWYVLAQAAGSDGVTRILWTNRSGAAALWLVNSAGTVQNAAVFGPIAGWTARDIAVDANGNTRILWTSASGAAVVWTVNSSFNVTSTPVFGPYAGWNAVKIAMGADGLLRLLWDNANGAAALWLVNASNGITVGLYGPIPGWTATGLAVGSDGLTRILWDTISGSAAIWQINNSFTVTGVNVYGAFAGWSAEALAAGPDGVLRLLWDNLDGTVALWLLANSGSFENAATYGPF